MDSKMLGQLTLLKEFVNICKKDPKILDMPELAFFREWLESFGAKFPFEPQKTSSTQKTDTDEEKDVPKEDSFSSEDEEEDPGVETDSESELELNEDDWVKVDNEKDTANQEMGPDTFLNTDGNFEVQEKADAKKISALDAMNAGNYQESVDLFTEAIMLYPLCAVYYAKRAQMLGKWENAMIDLSQALKIDYDEESNDLLKAVLPNAQKIINHRRKRERHTEEKLEAERISRVRRAQREHEKARDPEVAAAFQDISSNPANISKYMANPKVSKIMQKFMSKFGGAGGQSCFPNAN